MKLPFFFGIKLTALVAANNAEIRYSPITKSSQRHKRLKRTLHENRLL